MQYRSCKDCPKYTACVMSAKLNLKRKNCGLADNSRKKKPTNLDRIKSMSLEEMSDFLMEWSANLLTGKAPINVIKWLESEAQDDG